MRAQADAHDSSESSLARPSHGLASDLAELAKVRISALALVTTGLGYAVAAPGRFDFVHFAATGIGTALAACGANALNQLAERDLDAKMLRTKNRPLPAGRMTPRAAFAFGAACAIGGTLLLNFAVNALTAALALGTVLTYTLAYTPLKRRTPLCTLVGAVPGAIPPVIGVTAACGAITADALWLFLFLLLWQMPHFFAIAWLYRADYARGGFPMLAVVDPDGSRTARQSILYMAFLTAVAALPFVLGHRGVVYLAVALALNVAWGVFVVRFARAKTDAAARATFLASLPHLPLLLAAFVVLD